VEHVGEVPGRHAGHPADKGAVVDHGDRAAGLAQVVGGAETGDPAADHADVDVDVFLDGAALRERGGGRPDGFMAWHSATCIAKNAPGYFAWEAHQRCSCALMAGVVEICGRERSCPGRSLRSHSATRASALEKASWNEWLAGSASLKKARPK